MSSSAAAISVKNLFVTVEEKGAPRTLLSEVNLSIGQGTFVAVIGLSGCGKSTLIKTLAGFIEPTAGRVLVAGKEIEELNAELPLAIGYLPQFGAFHDRLTVEENLETAAALRLPRDVATKRKESWVNHITVSSRMTPLLTQQYRTLSGGQRRRMALAEELIGDPAFLLLDELTSGLDAYSDLEMMAWLRSLAHDMGKTVVLVTHAPIHLEYCDSILFLHEGKIIHFGSLHSLFSSHGVSSIAELFGQYQTTQPPSASSPRGETVRTSCTFQEGEQQIEIKSLPPPDGITQFPALLKRQIKLFWREKTQIILHLALILTFPLLVAVFAIGGLPQIRNQNLSLQTNVLSTLQDQLQYVTDSFQTATLISGLAMFQVILLTLIGANNGAREIAKERLILAKELTAGLSATSYLAGKFLQIVLLSTVQAFWMAWFVKTICGFPGNLFDQFLILFFTTMAMSSTCLAISAAAVSPEKASLLAIYLVGFQLPLSGAALALPEWLSVACRPFIAAYWGWSGYLQTFKDTRYFDIVRQSSETWIAPYGLSILVLALHTLLAFIISIALTTRVRTHKAT